MKRPTFRQRIREFYRALFPEGQSPFRIALAVFTGVFIGVLPTLGFALPLTAVTAGLFRLPKGPALVASFIATPPTLFLFFYPLGYLLGRTLTHPPEVQVNLLEEMRNLSIFTVGDVMGRLWHDARLHVVAFLVGMTIVALVTALIIAGISHYIVLHRSGEQSADPPTTP